MIYIILAILALVIFWVIGTYNFFVSSKTRINAAVQEIGNQLKRQADLIPNLESSVKGYMTHEKGVFKALTDARRAVAAASKSSDLQKMAEAGSKLAAVLPKLQIVVESNPEIKASEVVKKLMDELRDTSDKVMYSRRLVIDLTADYNVKRVSLPSNIVASLFKFEKLPGLITPNEGEFMKVSKEETKSPKVSI